MYKPPSWVKLSASEKNPPIKDFFLEVVKNEEVVDRIDICDKSHYLVGRNSDVCDIIADHQSLSRVHAALLFHPGMKKFFLHDNNSVHGTFIGKTRLTREPKPLSANSKFSFGASTRNYIIRKGAGHESQGVPTNDLTPEMQKAVMMGRLSLPEDQTELDNLTDSNTRKNLKCSAHIPSQVSYNPIGLLSKARKKRVSFAEHNQVVNLADIDDKIGKFKNLVSSTVVDDGKRKGMHLPKPRPKISLGMLGVDDDDDDYVNKKSGSKRSISPPPDIKNIDEDEFKGLDAEEAALLRAFKKKNDDKTGPKLNKQPKFTIDATPDL